MLSRNVGNSSRPAWWSLGPSCRSCPFIPYDTKGIYDKHYATALKNSWEIVIFGLVEQYRSPFLITPRYCCCRSLSLTIPRGCSNLFISYLFLECGLIVMASLPSYRAPLLPLLLSVRALSACPSVRLSCGSVVLSVLFVWCVFVVLLL